MISKTANTKFVKSARDAKTWRELLSIYPLHDKQARRNFYPFVIACMIRKEGGVVTVKDSDLEEVQKIVATGVPSPMEVTQLENGIRITLGGLGRTAKA